ncbi:MAG: translation initiation factor IF-2 [Mariprofundaceae bacterium]|nr:translation initiation factor IF-2 [Mariprofundaceae bacterium]
MANKRILELATELNVGVADLQRAAVDCGVAVSGPTSLLNEEDTAKIKASLKASAGKAAPAGGKTLTLNRPMVAGQSRPGSSVEGRGRTVQVAVRRRRTPGHQPAEAPVETATRAPAAAAKAAVSVEKKEAARAAAKTLSPAQRASQALENNRKVEAKSTPAPQHDARQKSTATRPSADARRGPQGSAQKSSGPRTTIRRGLTPAQIAAAKAPRSSMKQIEANISTERAARRKDAQSSGRRPAGAAGAPTSGTRRVPSVAVSPQPGGPAPEGIKRRGPGGPAGGPAGRHQKRRLSPAEKAAKRDYASKRNVVMTEEQLERQARLARGGRGRTKIITKDDADFVTRTVEVTDPIIVGELASRMAIKGGEVVKKLFEMGSPVTVNESIDAETAVLIVEEFGHTPKVINEAAVEDVLVETIEESEEDLLPRPPVVVVMGHVDHGKTSILDALRKAHVADGEAGGITQHIGAYMVKLESGERVVFVDTPGHEAFTGLRARGAKLTDVAVLVVAADDGVMPQTVEALNHARAAGVPIIVAVNKMDKEGADPEKVMRQLSEHEVVSEEWGGDTIFVPVSAHTGQGLDDLLEMLALQTEILELKANADRRGQGVVIESRLDKGRGPAATVLVQNGTFKQGDIVVVGTVMGRIRAIVDENAVQHKTAGPSIPFELLGLEEVPDAGLEIMVVENERQAREIISYRKEKIRQHGVATHTKASFDDLFASVQSGVAEVPILIKGDVTGSVEAMADSMVKAGTDEVKVKVIHKGIGGITESDVMLASAANAIIIGFNVRPEAKAKKVAENEGVDIRFYKVIYDAIDDIRAAMAGKLSPDKVEKVIGSAEVRDVFQVPKIGAVAGCYMTDGYAVRNAHVRVLREGVLIYDGTLASLRRFKDDVKEVKSGYECGIGIDKFNDVKVGDSFEFYIIEEVAATL